MPPESIFLLVSTAVAVLLGAGAVVAALRSRSDQTAIQAGAGDLRDQGQADKYEVDRGGLERRGRGSYGTAVRVLWWVSIASVLIGVGLSDAYDQNQAAIYALGAIAVVAAVGLHDLLPDRRRTQAVIAFEIVLAIVLTTVLLVLTDYASSPFVFVYLLIAVAVARRWAARSRWWWPWRPPSPSWASWRSTHSWPPTPPPTCCASACRSAPSGCWPTWPACSPPASGACATASCSCPGPMS